MARVEVDASPLSVREAEVLAFVREYMGGMGQPPTIREITRGCEIASTSNTQYTLRILQRKGYLKLTPEIARGIKLLPYRDGRCPYCNGSGRIGECGEGNG